MYSSSIAESDTDLRQTSEACPQYFQNNWKDAWYGNINSLRHFTVKSVKKIEIFHWGPDKDLYGLHCIFFKVLTFNTQCKFSSWQIDDIFLLYHLHMKYANGNIVFVFPFVH